MRPIFQENIGNLIRVFSSLPNALTCFTVGTRSAGGTRAGVFSAAIWKADATELTGVATARVNLWTTNKNRSWKNFSRNHHWSWKHFNHYYRRIFLLERIPWNQQKNKDSANSWQAKLSRVEVPTNPDISGPKCLKTSQHILSDFGMRRCRLDQFHQKQKLLAALAEE